MSIRKKLAAVVALVMALTLSMPMSAFAGVLPQDVPAGTKVLIWTTQFRDASSPEELEGLIVPLAAMGDIISDIYSAFSPNITTDVILGLNTETGICSRNELPELDDYSLVFVIMPAVMPTQDEINELKGVVDRGGRIVLVAENNEAVPNENAIQSQIADALGADFYIGNGSYGQDFNKQEGDEFFRIPSERNTASNLYSETIEQNYVAPIIYSGKAQWVYRLQDYDWDMQWNPETGEPTFIPAGDLKTITWCVDQAASKGRITVISDIDCIIDPYLFGGTDTDATEFIQLLLLDALNNESTVEEGGDPNEGFGDDAGKYIPKSDNENVSIDSDVDLKEIVPLTDEEKALVDGGADVIVTIRVEDGEDKVSEADKKEIEKNLGENELGMYLDISMFKQVGDNPEVKLTTLGDKIKITANLPEELVNNDDAIERTYKVIRVHDGVTDILDAEYDPVNKTITFETDRFSSYAIVYNDVEKSAEEPIAPENGISPKTGALSYTLAIFAMVAIAGAGLVVANRKRER